MPLVAQDFTWEFIFDTNSAWPMAHILNPFMLEILLQKSWLTLIIIWAWESFEVLAVVIFNGQYVIFVGDDSEIEVITDTLLGDIFQGILGIILARLVILAWRIPEWAPNPIRHNLRTGYGTLFFKRLLQYIFWVASLSFTNTRIDFTGTYSVNIGVFIALISTVFFWYTWFKSNNRTLTEKEFLWEGYTIQEYLESHLGILINALLLIMSASLHIWYSYFVTWIFWSIAFF
jgi:hypothetical protein